LAIFTSANNVSFCSDDGWRVIFNLRGVRDLTEDNGLLRLYVDDNLISGTNKACESDNFCGVIGLFNLTIFRGLFLLLSYPVMKLIF
jgi:hypothetical protein